MKGPLDRSTWPVIVVISATLLTVPAGLKGRAAESDLDQLMAQVLARRDENWKKLQQYVLDERERVQVLGPGRVRVFGLERDYTWFIRQGFFVRSPLRADGVAIGESERREYEARWLERARRRDARGRQPAADGEADAVAPEDIADILKQTREPLFISTAYFLRFRFEEGRYALAGRDSIEGRETLRIEYYPARLIRNRRDERGRRSSDSDNEQAERIERQMNKVALVTLWVEPGERQILKYTFDNVGFDFLPGRWLARLDDLHATMQMTEPFPGVWLPRSIDGRLALTLAKGTLEVLYDLLYTNYRQADVKVEIR